MESASAIQSIELIAVNPQIRDGRAHILGTTVTVSDVVIARNYHAQDADGIADWYGLTLSQVYAALAYYYANKPEIDDQIRAQIRHAEEIKEKRVGSRHTLLS